MHDYKVMIVDDDEILQFTTRRMLQFVVPKDNISGYTSPFAAMEYLRNHQHDPATMPNIILLDINMPVMDGFEFLDHLTADVITNIPIVLMVSSSIDKGDITKSLSYRQVKEYITKPLSPEVLNAAISKHVG